MGTVSYFSVRILSGKLKAQELMDKLKSGHYGNCLSQPYVSEPMLTFCYEGGYSGETEVERELFDILRKNGANATVYIAGDDAGQRECSWYLKAKYGTNGQRRKTTMSEERCTCCGREVPEGRQVCWDCEHEWMDHDSGLTTGEDHGRYEWKDTGNKHYDILCDYLITAITEYPIVLCLIQDAVHEEQDAMKQVLENDDADDIESKTWFVMHMLSLIEECAPKIFEALKEEHNGMPEYVRPEDYGN